MVVCLFCSCRLSTKMLKTLENLQNLYNFLKHKLPPLPATAQDRGEQIALTPFCKNQLKKKPAAPATAQDPSPTIEMRCRTTHPILTDPFLATRAECHEPKGHVPQYHVPQCHLPKWHVPKWHRDRPQLHTHPPFLHPFSPAESDGCWECLYWPH